jgi:hypothetical protein
MWKRLLLAALIGWGAYSSWSARSVSYGPGVVAPQAPVQREVSSASPFDYKGYRITPLAQFSAEARVLAREDYRIGREAELARTDLALGWRRMSDKAVLEKIDIGQSNRFYYWSVKEFPIPQREIETSSANMHLIPADSAIESKLDQVRIGQVVHLRGYLVRVEASDGWRWMSSLTREDTGAGACELVWVEELNSL